ncbi:MAG: FtsX-like permease family protein [Clostridiaceae bacterium]
MQRILNMRVIRDLKKNFFRYAALFLLIVLGMYVITSIVGAAENIIVGVQSSWKTNKVEDGEFTVFVPLDDSETEKLKQNEITLEKEFYLDYLLKDNSTLRIYQNRENINLINLDKGKLASRYNEIVLEKQYAKDHKITVGSQIEMYEEKYIVTGIGSTPDYDLTLKNISDSTVNTNFFGIGFVSKDQYEQLKKEVSTKSENYVYSYLLNGNITDKELKNILSGMELDKSKVTDEYFLKMLDGYFDTPISNLTQFIKNEDNPRIGASVDDVLINKYAGMVAGIIIMILFTYVISVFVIHGIEQESSVIGSLYALGVKKRQLITHYLILPVTVTFLAGIVGMIIGFSSWGIDVQMAQSEGYFSLPTWDIIHPFYLLIYGTVMPAFIAIVTNYFVINKKLSKPALKMIRNEQKQNKISNLNLGNMQFIRRFQIRQFLREIRTSFTVVFGMFIALLIMMLGIDCYTICHNMNFQNKADTKYEYMYSYKYPTSEVPEGGEACYAAILKKKVFGYNLDVTLLGIEENNPYFDFDVKTGKNKIAISQSVATKYNLKTGEKFVLKDEVNNVDYTFTVDKIVPYSVGLYVFMNTNDMRELFNQKDDYYNVVFSDKNLDIDPGRLYATTTKKDIIETADVFINQMIPMIISLIVTSIIIFIVVMYLMMKVMIDRSSLNISLMKIFGFRQKEIRKLYLDGNFIMIIISSAICIPLSKFVMDSIYPYFVSNVACGMDLTFSWQMYIGIYTGVILCYLLINRILTGRLKKMAPTELLKNRE